MPVVIKMIALYNVLSSLLTHILISVLGDVVVPDKESGNHQYQWA